MKRIPKILVVVGFAGLLASFVLAQPLPYKAVAVPNSSPNTSTAINDNGQVVVNGGTASLFNVSMWTRTGGIQDLGVVGPNDVGTSINIGGDIAGAGLPEGSNNLQAFLWQQSTGVQFLGTLGGTLSGANGVNAGLDVVGMAYTSGEYQHAFLWSSASGMQDLTPTLTSLGGATAMAINTSGEVVGYYYPNGATNVTGFTWTSSGGFANFGAAGTLAMAVNDSGAIVGQHLTASGYKHAFSWTSSGGTIDLGTLGGNTSTALSINNNGWIIGTSLTGDKTGLVHGFLWRPSAGMVDFTTLAAAIGPGAQPYAMQINDYGDIAVSTKKGLLVLIPTMTLTGSSSANPSVLGNPVTVTATMSSIAGPPPDGETLEFYVGGVAAGTAPMTNGVAKLTISGIKAGSHPVAVGYSGDANYLPVRTTVFTQVVNQ